MRTFTFSTVLLCGLVACGGDPAPTPPPAKEEPAPPPAKTPEPPPEPVAAAFDAKVTFETVCGACHGLTGAGDGVAGAALDPKPTSFTDAAFWTEERDDAYLAKVITEGGASVGKSPLMAPFGGQFDEAQVAALVEHVKSFKPAE